MILQSVPVAVFLGCSYLDQYYSSSTPNFAVGSARRREAEAAAAAPNGGDFEEQSRQQRQRAGTVGARSEPGHALVRAAAPALPASASDLATRGDTLASPRVSPLLWFQQCLLPSLVVTSHAGQRARGKCATSRSINRQRRYPEMLS